MANVQPLHACLPTVGVYREHISLWLDSPRPSYTHTSMNGELPVVADLFFGSPQRLHCTWNNEQGKCTSSPITCLKERIRCRTFRVDCCERTCACVGGSSVSRSCKPQGISYHVTSLTNLKKSVAVYSSDFATTHIHQCCVLCSPRCTYCTSCILPLCKHSQNPPPPNKRKQPQCCTQEKQDVSRTRFTRITSPNKTPTHVGQPPEMLIVKDVAVNRRQISSYWCSVILLRLTASIAVVVAVITTKLGDVVHTSSMNNTVVSRHFSYQFRTPGSPYQS